MNDLKPLAFGDIFNYTFRILRRKYLHLYMAMGWLHLPLALLYSYHYNRALGSFAGGLPGQGGPGFGFDALLQSYLVLALYTLVQQLLKPLTDAGAVQVVTRAVRGEETKVSDIFRAVFSAGNWRRLLALGIMIAAIMLMGTLALFLPALFFGVTFALVTQVMVVEKTSIWRALSRSWAMVLKDFGRVLLVFLVMGLLTYFVTGVVTAPVTLGVMLLMFLQVEHALWFTALSLLSGFLTLLAAPVPVIALTLLYHDLRARREGIDLESRIDALR